MIGVFIGERIMYATNFVASFEDQVYLKRLTTLDDYVVYNTWYKVDLHLNWDTKMYYLMLNDVVVVKDVPFAADSFDGIRLSQTRQVDVWYDEIYVGFDTLMDYMCPLVDRAGVRTWETQQQGWAADEITGYSKVNGHATADSGIPVYQPMMRHYSHLDLNGPLHFDGAAHLLVTPTLSPVALSHRHLSPLTLPRPRRPSITSRSHYAPPAPTSPPPPPAACRKTWTWR